MLSGESSSTAIRLLFFLEVNLLSFFPVNRIVIAGRNEVSGHCQRTVYYSRMVPAGGIGLLI